MKIVVTLDEESLKAMVADHLNRNLGTGLVTPDDVKFNVLSTTLMIVATVEASR